MAERTPYRVEVWDLDAFFEILSRFPPAQQERITDLMANHLTVRPKTLIPGLLIAHGDNVPIPAPSGELTILEG